MQSNRWCFTLNNYSDADITSLSECGANVGRDGVPPNGIRFLCYGLERGDNGTPHVQGFVITESRFRLRGIRDFLGAYVGGLGTAHYESARGSTEQNVTYCSKDGDFKSFGEPPPLGRPKQPSVPEYCDWCRSVFAETQLAPSERSIAASFPALYLRYGAAKLLSLSSHVLPEPRLEESPPSQWQLELETELLEEPDDRKIIFVIDINGGNGKSWFCRWFYTKYAERTQLLGVGKRDDLAFAVDVSKSVFFFNVPRHGMEFLQYQVLEMMKDRVIFSPKYTSVTKIMSTKVHIVVMCNERPDYTKMTDDRYKEINL